MLIAGFYLCSNACEGLIAWTAFGALGPGLSLVALSLAFVALPICALVAICLSIVRVRGVHGLVRPAQAPTEWVEPIAIAALGLTALAPLFS